MGGMEDRKNQAKANQKTGRANINYLLAYFLSFFLFIFYFRGKK